jgi:hypothetical protein
MYSILPIFYIDGAPVEYEYSFLPIPELQTPDADLTVLFISANGVLFSSPIHDPWYKATTYIGHATETFSNGTTRRGSEVYMQDQAASLLACKVRNQICNPTQPETNRCGPLAPAYEFFNAALAAGVFPDKDAATRRLAWAYFAGFGTEGHLGDLLITLGTQILTSRRGLSDGFQGGLPDDQWMVDVQHWNDVALASIQGSLLATALGPTDANGARWYSRRPNNTEESVLCHSQVRTLRSY